MKFLFLLLLLSSERKEEPILSRIRNAVDWGRRFSRSFWELAVRDEFNFLELLNMELRCGKIAWHFPELLQWALNVDGLFPGYDPDWPVFGSSLS